MGAMAVATHLIRGERADKGRAKPVDLDEIPRDVTAWDEATFRDLTTLALTPDQVERVATPKDVYPRQTAVLAVHWHSEHVPMDLVERRLAATFPNRRHELVIPTNHNVLTSRAGFTGVEIDCHSPSFNRKVQLLVHMTDAAAERADRLRFMLAHTFRYRTGQLYEYLASILDPVWDDRMQAAAAQTGADEDLVDFVRLHAAKLRSWLEANELSLPPDSIKNKLVAGYFDALRDHYDGRLIGHAQALLKAVKEIVKSKFALTYFYRTQEVIEECRALGAGVVIPHPEQFWPVLLAGYDVDGIEVWNPQSREYTEFLIEVVLRENAAGRRKHPLFIFMGDDCHLGEKCKEARHQNPEKAGREVGVQPAWEDLAIRKRLGLAGVSRETIIEQYRERLRAGQ